MDSDISEKFQISREVVFSSKKSFLSEYYNTGDKRLFKS